MYKKNRKQTICSLLVCLLLVLLNTSCSNKRKPEVLSEKALENIYRETEKPEVFEAFFRYIFDNNYSAAQQKAKMYFIEIDGENPSRNFLKRFDKHSPEVRKGSQYRQGEGLLFWLKFTTWIDNNTVKVQGGYDESGLSGSSAPYLLKKKDGKWSVTEVGPMIIS